MQAKVITTNTSVKVRIVGGKLKLDGKPLEKLAYQEIKTAAGRLGLKTTGRKINDLKLALRRAAERKAKNDSAATASSRKPEPKEVKAQAAQKPEDGKYDRYKVYYGNGELNRSASCVKLYKATKMRGSDINRALGLQEGFAECALYKARKRKEI